ncbi:MAG: response regulator [Armatimonadetes bacterium]|nr:response regulator [Armatimonadota bacterium]
MEAVKVIIADDEPLTRLDLKATLEELGHRVIAEADEGRQAVALTRTLRPDLVILDIMMPGQSGLEVAQALYSENLAPVILLTGYAEEDMIARADAAGVLAYLRKPFRKEDLPPAIVLALGRHRERRLLAEEIESLKDKMEARKLMGRAKALLMERYNLTEREAFHRIQSQSQTLDKPPQEIARAIITASEISL